MLLHQEQDYKKRVSNIDVPFVNSGHDSDPLTNKTYLKKTDIENTEKGSTEYLEPDFRTKLKAKTKNLEPEINHYIEFYEGGSLVRAKTTVTDPLSNHSENQQLRGIKNNITTFTHKSRLNLINQLCMINQGRIPEGQVWFLTLTLDGGISKNYECKKYLNNFLTQLRKKYEGKKWFYCWKLEFQRRGVVHYHICFFGLKRMHHYWIRETWSRITMSKKDFERVCSSTTNRQVRFRKLVITDLARSKGWGETELYFSKTLGYVSKCDDGQRALIGKYNSHRPVGRFWGIGNKKIYKSFVDRRIIKMTTEEYHKVRRGLIKCLKSRWLRTHGDNFDRKMWKNYKRYLETGFTTKSYKTRKVSILNPYPEIRLFMNNDILEKMFRCYFPDKENIFDSDTEASNKEKWESSKFIIKVRVKVEVKVLRKVS